MSKTETHFNQLNLKAIKKINSDNINSITKARAKCRELLFQGNFCETPQKAPIDTAFQN